MNTSPDHTTPKPDPQGDDLTQPSKSPGEIEGGRDRATEHDTAAEDGGQRDSGTPGQVQRGREQTQEERDRATARRQREGATQPQRGAADQQPAGATDPQRGGATEPNRGPTSPQQPGRRDRQDPKEYPGGSHRDQDQGNDDDFPPPDPQRST